MKTIKVSSVVYEMLQSLSKKARLKPEVYVDKLLQNVYNGKAPP